MGWTWYHCAARKANGKPDVKVELDNQITWGKFTVLKSAMVGSTYYAAVEDKEDDRVFAAVVLTSVNTRDYFDFGYKEMAESWGPWKADCPDSILALLTPTDDESSREWRARCRANNEERKWFAGLEDGATVDWVVPTSGFRYFDEGQKVTLVKAPLNSYACRSKRVWKALGMGIYLDRCWVKSVDTVLRETA